MNPKKITVFLAWLIILVAIVGFAVYYLQPVDQESSKDFSQRAFELKLVREMEEWEVERFTKEFDALVTVLQEDPDHFDSWLGLANIKKILGDYEGAEEILLHANSIRPLNSTSFNNLGDLYANFLGQYDKAEVQYRIAIENSLGESLNVAFYRNLHDMFLNHLQDEGKVGALLLEGLEHNPNSADLWVLQGRHYLRINDTTQAIAAYQKALSLNPDNQALQRELDTLLE